MSLRASALALLGCLACASASAQETEQDKLGWGEGDVESSAARSDELGWQDDAATPAAPSVAPSPEETSGWLDKLSAQGTLRLRGGAWVERPSHPFAQARTSIDLAVRYSDAFVLGGAPAQLRLEASGHGEYDAAYVGQHSLYDAATREVYEWQAWLAETYVSLSRAGLTLTVGRQTQNLGQAEVLGFVDVLNPRDLREPGMTDLDGIRLPVLMTRIGFVRSRFGVEAVVVHESRPSLLPPPLGRFSPFRKVILGDPVAGPALADRTLRLSQTPLGFAPDRWQMLGRASYSGGGLDLEVYAGSILDRLGVVGNAEPAAFAAESVALPLFHPRYTLIAVSGALTISEVLLRWEVGTELHKTLATRVTETPLLQFGWVQKDVIQGLFGLTYFGLKGSNIGVEAQKAYVIDPPNEARERIELLWPVTRPAFALRWTHTIGDDVLQLHLLGALIGLESVNGGFVRGEIARQLRDGLLLSAGYLSYLAGDEFGPFYGFERNDRAQLQLRWDFAVD